MHGWAWLVTRRHELDVIPAICHIQFHLLPSFLHTVVSVNNIRNIVRYLISWKNTRSN